MQSDLRAVLEQLTDENNDQPIELINDRGEKATFSQMALIPVSAPSSEYEDEVVEHHFALLQPLNDRGEEMGSRVVFDFIKDESGEISVKLIDDPYVMRNVLILYRERGNQFEEEEEVEECESIFGGTLTGTKEADESDRSDKEDDAVIEKELELQEYVNPHKEEKKNKKGFFGKLFGKK